MAIAREDVDAQDALTGWFAVDSITYTAGVLTQIDVRFEQHWEGGRRPREAASPSTATPQTTTTGKVIGWLPGSARDAWLAAKTKKSTGLRSNGVDWPQNPASGRHAD